MVKDTLHVQTSFTQAISFWQDVERIYSLPSPSLLKNIHAVELLNWLIIDALFTSGILHDICSFAVWAMWFAGGFFCFCLVALKLRAYEVRHRLRACPKLCRFT